MPDNIKRSTHTCILVIDAPAAHSGKNGQSLCFRTLELGCVQRLDSHLEEDGEHLQHRALRHQAVIEHGGEDVVGQHADLERESQCQSCTKMYEAGVTFFGVRERVRMGHMRPLILIVRTRVTAPQNLEQKQGACPWVVTQSASPRTNCDLLAPLRVKELQGEQQLDQRVFQASDQEGATPARGKTSTGQAALP
eukprot:1075592-Pelagomonas_calceolata.AAC.5